MATTETTEKHTFLAILEEYFEWFDNPQVSKSGLQISFFEAQLKKKLSSGSKLNPGDTVVFGFNLADSTISVSRPESESYEKYALFVALSPTVVFGEWKENAN